MAAVKSGEELYDVRTVERHIKQGLITEKDHKKFLDSLEDCAEQAQECETRMTFDVARRHDEEEAEGSDSAEA